MKSGPDKVVLSLTVTEKGEAGSGTFIGCIARFDIRAEADSAAGAMAKAVSALKKYALKTAIDEEISDQAELPLKGTKKPKAAKKSEPEPEKGGFDA